MYVTHGQHDTTPMVTFLTVVHNCPLARTKLHNWKLKLGMQMQLDARVMNIYFYMKL